MKKTLFFLALFFIAQYAKAQDTVSLQVCTSFWATSEHIEGVFISGAVISTGIPPVVLFYEDTTCVDYSAVVPDDFPPNSTINFSAEKDGDDNNGVNVLDLVAMSGHILGLAPLASPYAIIAADANKSNSVTTFDIVETRKLILGVYTEFPNNTSWRFFPENCIFPNPVNPFAGSVCLDITPEDLTFYDGGTFDIIGLKTGDVTGDAEPEGLYNGPVYNDSISLILPDIQLLAGVPTVVEIKLGDGSVNFLNGFQTSFNYNTDKVDFVGIEQTPWSDLSSIGAFFGKINVVCVNANGIPTETAFLKLLLQSTETVALSEVFSINPSYQYSMGVTGYSNPTIFKLKPAFGASSSTNTPIARHRVSPAYPNPFGAQTAIDLELSQSETVRLEVFDLNGQLRHVQENPFPAGQHRLTIPAEALEGAHIGFYRLQAGTLIVTGKVRNEE